MWVVEVQGSEVALVPDLSEICCLAFGCGYFATLIRFVIAFLGFLKQL